MRFTFHIPAERDTLMRKWPVNGAQSLTLAPDSQMIRVWSMPRSDQLGSQGPERARDRFQGAQRRDQNGAFSEGLLARFR
jgi:hypothetical protein